MVEKISLHWTIAKMVKMLVMVIKILNSEFCMVVVAIWVNSCSVIANLELISKVSISHTIVVGWQLEVKIKRYTSICSVHLTVLPVLHLNVQPVLIIPSQYQEKIAFVIVHQIYSWIYQVHQHNVLHAQY